MSDPMNPTTGPARHPELVAWLTERLQAFPHWAHRAGGTDLFDFTPASLGVLDDLIRETFDDADDIDSATRLGDFVQGAVWYVGEMMCRTHGMVWQYTPEPLDDGTFPPLFDPADTPALDTPSVAFPGAAPSEGFYPLNILRRMLIDEDEIGMPVDDRLVDVLDPDYLKDDGAAG
ncbi:hypothetical protein ABT174_18640 [Streptomyces sparsogenes]|uniref:hypothetical protein n=1 Tax=Streptomyces sparsogenes TaxID=67365 RepID=UPI003329699C